MGAPPHGGNRQEHPTHQSWRGLALLAKATYRTTRIVENVRQAISRLQPFTAQLLPAFHRTTANLRACRRATALVIGIGIPVAVAGRRTIRLSLLILRAKASH